MYNSSLIYEPRVLYSRCEFYFCFLQINVAKISKRRSINSEELFNAGIRLFKFK